jgi:hypothetical protein
MQDQKKKELKWEIIAWITGFDLSKGDYERKKINQPFDPNWTFEDFLAETKDGHHALWIAAQAGETEKFFQMYEIIKQHKPKYYRSAFYKLDNHGKSILHAAASCPDNKLIIIAILDALKSNKNRFYTNYLEIHDFVNLRETEFGKTAIHMAAHYESWDNMVTILNYGANPFMKDYFGSAPFDYIKGKNPNFVNKFIQFLEVARFRGKQRHVQEYKVDLVNEMQECRKTILRNADDHRKRIVNYYKDAIAKFNLIEKATPCEKNKTVQNYQKAFKLYYDSCDEWRQQITDYKHYYESFKPLIKETATKKSFFSQYSISGFFRRLKKVDDYDHHSFLEKMSEQDRKLKTDIHKLQMPERSFNPFKIRFSAATCR